MPLAQRASIVLYFSKPIKIQQQAYTDTMPHYIRQVAHNYPYDATRVLKSHDTNNVPNFPHHQVHLPRTTIVHEFY